MVGCDIGDDFKVVNITAAIEEVDGIPVDQLTSSRQRILVPARPSILWNHRMSWSSNMRFQPFPMRI